MYEFPKLSRQKYSKYNGLGESTDLTVVSGMRHEFPKLSRQSFNYLPITL